MNDARRPWLIILGGLPGSGKTSVARVLAQRIGAAHLRIDTIEQALRRSGELAGEVEGAGYLVAHGLAADNLRLGLSVIADSVNPWKLTREGWRQVAVEAAVPYLEVEIICGDPEEHRRRVESRAADIAGHKLPTWEEVLQRDYQPWTSPHLVLDTAVLRPEDAAVKISEKLW